MGQLKSSCNRVSVPQSSCPGVQVFPEAKKEPDTQRLRKFKDQFTEARAKSRTFSVEKGGVSRVGGLSSGLWVGLL